ncbi:MAG: nitroreductase family deazaflavin-dependent oxidoreductase [Myxococcota bacterium]
MSAGGLEQLDRHWNCRLTATGRRSGQPRTVTIWFVAEPGRVLLTGGKEDPHWCRNVRAHPEVEVEIGGRRMRGKAHVVDDPQEGAAIRDRFVRKYLLARISRLFGGYTGSVPVVVEISE